MKVNKLKGVVSTSAWIVVFLNFLVFHANAFKLPMGAEIAMVFAWVIVSITTLILGVVFFFRVKSKKSNLKEKLGGYLISSFAIIMGAIAPLFFIFVFLIPLG